MQKWAQKDLGLTNRPLAGLGNRGTVAGRFPGEEARRQWEQVAEKREGARAHLLVVSVGAERT